MRTILSISLILLTLNYLNPIYSFNLDKAKYFAVNEDEFEDDEGSEEEQENEEIEENA
jgi:hypothetical protein